jgi:acetate kinase
VVAEGSWPADGFNHDAATRELLSKGTRLIGGARVIGIGHRVVHGGMKYAAPIRVDRDVLAALSELIPLAPLHQPHNLAPIRTILDVSPDMPQVACFDTAFHRGQTHVAQMFALPRQFTDAGVRRFGFHGLSYEYLVSQLRVASPELASGRVIIAHLGNGASLCAVRDGRSVASTMGFTAVDGLMMGTRCGALDPGVLLYLMQEHRMDAKAIEDLIYRRSGLLGVSDISSDMRTLRASLDPAAREAIALFVYRIVREVGSLTAALGGLDALIFSGGIGENDAATRAEVADGCGWTGALLDSDRNSRGERRISADASRIPVLVIPTDEERLIARHTIEQLASQ